MNFAAVDLNLLRVFDAMMLDLNTGRAGERLGLSQPAVSSALGRLRHIAGDPLFIREGNRMIATSRASDLAVPIRAALQQIETALAATASFDPQTAAQTIRIIGSDYFSSLLMPSLLRSVHADAPGMIVQMLDRPTGEIPALLADGAADFAVDARIVTPDWISEHALYQSYITTVARSDDPRLAGAALNAGDRIPPDLFCQLSHVIMSMDGGLTGTIDRELAKDGLRRRVVATVPHFHAVALLVAEAGVLGSLPVHFARHVAPTLGLTIYRPPFDPPRLDVMLYWHRRRDGDAAMAWVRSRIVSAMSFSADEKAVGSRSSATSPGTGLALGPSDSNRKPGRLASGLDPCKINARASPKNG